MSGTVSAGAYTAGVLIELNRWLSSFQGKAGQGITLKATTKTKNFNIGDDVPFSPGQLPRHEVKIKALSGASGGGVSAALFLMGLTTGKVQDMLYDVWMNLDINGMLDNSDIGDGQTIYSMLNSGPIDDLMSKLAHEEWGSEDLARDIGYIENYVELFMTLASLEGIPYATRRTGGMSQSYGVHQTHLDYIRFVFNKNGTTTDYGNPYPYELLYRKNFTIGADSNWKQLIKSAPATAAFPFGFKARSLRRFRKEYRGKLFYLNFSTESGSGKKVDFTSLEPAWLPGNDDDVFDMEYVDGGTFNREPHDLVRATLIRSLDSGNHLPNTGEKCKATVLLIDPFPSSNHSHRLPGNVIKQVPSLTGLVPPLIGALMNQGRFRPDWIERSLDSGYYSRMLIAPTKRGANSELLDNPLAGSALGAFAGFLDREFREHDYHLGRYNTFQFLNKHFTVPHNNEVVNYFDRADQTLKEKYTAVGWCYKDGETEHVQIIPRTFESNDPLANTAPIWPKMSMDRWNEIESKFHKRARVLADTATNFGRFGEGVVDPAIWKFGLKKKVNSALNEIKDVLVDRDLLRGVK